MNEHHEHHVRKETLVERSRYPHISWGAILAGVVVLLATSWMLHLLGLAIGVSLADSYDSVTMEGTLTQGGALWCVLTWIASFFVGSLVAARLCGSADDTAGMLHGVTLWGTSTVAIAMLGYLGLSTLFATGSSALSATASGLATATTSVASVTATGAQKTASAVVGLVDEELADTVSQRLKSTASEAIAAIDEEGGVEVSEDDIRSAIDDLSDQSLNDLVAELTDGNTEGAVELLVDETELTEEQADALISGAYEKLEERFGNPENEEGLAGDLQNQLAEGVDGYVASLDAKGGPEVSEQDVQQAIEDLDAGELQAVSYALLQGKKKQAKKLLANSTDLSKKQINDLVKGVSKGIEEEIEQYQEQANDAVEVVSDYSRGLLWLSFTGAALGLAISVLGGWLGTEASERVTVHQSSAT